MSLKDKQLFDEDTGIQWYLEEDVRKAVLEFKEEYLMNCDGTKHLMIDFNNLIKKHFGDFSDN